ncbi:MAG: exodeoxyribonuclease VII large subunit [Solirubrobacterales bacterium]|nr:exodeoxyribonuclease VII large subunit [Solirubrobacterales bacterium]
MGATPEQPQIRPVGIEGSELKGPFPVGEYAEALRSQLRGFARVQVFGEVSNLGIRQKAVYFELRDDRGALPCSMWRSDYDRAGVELANGAQVVLAGGCDYYPGSATSSPSFSFRASGVKLAGEGELLAAIERLRRRLGGEGLFEPQKALARPALPRAIGVVTGETGKARDDVLAGLRRRGWAGRLVWAFAPVQDRHAAPRITRAIQDLAAVGGVETIVVARGGGSVMDLMAFSDETLCRTVALLGVPVISSVGHHSDRTLIDDVAAVACSTPTHAAETAVRVDVGQARAAALGAARRLDGCGRRALVTRARHLAALSRAPDQHIARQRAWLHQKLRELRAAGARQLAGRRDHSRRHLLVLSRKAEATAREGAAAQRRLHGRPAELARAAGADRDRRRRELDRLRATLAAHDPERALERGFALVEREDGELVTSAEAARAAGAVAVRFRDGSVRARIEDE